jgi:hypothetical protein
MAYKQRATYKTETDSKFVQGQDKWTGKEVEDAFIDMADSADWIDAPYTMASNTFDGGNGRFQQRTLTANSTLTVTNCTAGQFYAIRKIGAFTLTLPTSNKYTTDTRIVPEGEYYITFVYTGSVYIFSFVPLNSL